jgi:hypothetical protein
VGIKVWSFTSVNFSCFEGRNLEISILCKLVFEQWSVFNFRENDE